MTLDDKRMQAARKMLRLLSAVERDKAAQMMGVEGPHDADGIVDALRGLPRFHVLPLLLLCAEPTVLMLKDILRFLEARGVAARTTTCALLLADPLQARSRVEVSLSPQASAVVCDWTPRGLKRLGDDPFSDARVVWRKLIPTWTRLLSRASPAQDQSRIDLVRSYIYKRTIHEEPRDHTDHSAGQVLEHLCVRVRRLAETLERAPKEYRSISHAELVNDLRKLLDAAEAKVFRPLCRNPIHRRNVQRRTAKQTMRAAQIGRYVGMPFVESFDRLCEDILTLGDAVREDEIFDLVQADLWSSRPQLFEIWLLIQILGWLHRRGWSVRLLGLTETSSRVKWQLSYAKAAKPCAEVISPDGTRSEMFFQLYRRTGDMPDICLIDGKVPLWAVDAKHSELAGYALGTYRGTAQRYRDSFRAKVSLAAEYF